MRFLEKLPVPLSPEYRVALEEEDIAALATVFLIYLESTPDPSEVVKTVALSFCEVLKQVKGEDHRWFQKMAHKLRKKSS